MAWGAMGGIGEALTNLSANMAEMDKAKLRDKLEADRYRDWERRLFVLTFAARRLLGIFHRRIPI